MFVVDHINEVANVLERVLKVIVALKTKKAVIVKGHIVNRAFPKATRNLCQQRRLSSHAAS